MDGIFNRKRKSKKEKIENLYKILGTRSNIGQDRIKEKYIEKLREFPPETHPEEFQEIRKAYETLKEPKKRKQYDMTRKYGDKLEKTMEDVIYSMETGDYKNAKQLLKYVAEMDPDNIAIKCLQAEVLLELDELEQFFARIDDLLENCDMEFKEQVITFEVNVLMSNDYGDEALEVLEQNKSYYEDIKEYYSLRIKIFIRQDNFQQAWVEFKYALPPIEEQTIDDSYLLITWLNTAMELEKWGDVSKIENHIKKLAKSIVEEEELSILKGQLIEEAEAFIEVARYREGSIFLRLISQMDKDDIEIREYSKKIQEIVNLDIELTRAMKDRELFPYVYFKILDLYLHDYSTPEYYDMFLDDYPHYMMSEMEYMNEDIAHGILRIKKKYPKLYREYKEELTGLFNKSTEGFNREQRRRLK